MIDQSKLEPIPQPPGHPIIGNLLDLRGEVPLANLMNLAEIYGPIFRLRIGGRSILVLSLGLAATGFSWRSRAPPQP